jgi:drug/metabolite transporter (DMT)-like permease
MKIITAGFLFAAVAAGISLLITNNLAPHFPPVWAYTLAIIWFALCFSVMVWIYLYEAGRSNRPIATALLVTLLGPLGVFYWLWHRSKDRLKSQPAINQTEPSGADNAAPRRI